MFRKIKKKYQNFLKSKFLITQIEGDNEEYEILDRAVKRLKNPQGLSFEIGVRRGMGSKKIIDAYRKYHPKLKNVIHIGLDPYGSLPYIFSEDRKNSLEHNYTNLMKREMLINFSKKYQEYNFVNLDTHEFFKRFRDGYPIYSGTKKIIDKFEIVHFDGLHDLENVNLEINYFLDHLCPQTIFVFDDISSFDFDKIRDKLTEKKFKEIEFGKTKSSFEYFE
ncbi:MAG: class I SAM-dependent methyltransferase [Pseudomonadota bacterium]|nr:class I SAM-dependent methyltransferase [Pseudomonadota bacterium]